MYLPQLSQQDREGKSGTVVVKCCITVSSFIFGWLFQSWLYMKILVAADLERVLG